MAHGRGDPARTDFDLDDGDAGRLRSLRPGMGQRPGANLVGVRAAESTGYGGCRVRSPTVAGRWPTDANLMPTHAVVRSAALRPAHASVLFEIESGWWMVVSVVERRLVGVIADDRPGH